MAKALVDIPDEMIEELNKMAIDSHSSRSALIRKAIGFFIKQQLPKTSTKKAFGLLKNSKIDALEFQHKMRSEWKK
jgi:metal-responsive CopG/Arc/MetJ family transcriptional regulator